MFTYFLDEKAYKPFLVQSAWMDMLRISWKWSYFISDTILATDDSLQNDDEACVPKIDFAIPHPLLLDVESNTVGYALLYVFSSVGDAKVGQHAEFSIY